MLETGFRCKEKIADRCEIAPEKQPVDVSDQCCQTTRFGGTTARHREPSLDFAQDQHAFRVGSAIVHAAND